MLDLTQGNLREYRIDKVAGTASGSIKVPPGKRWLILAIHLRIITDATVANRVPYLYYTTGGTLTNKSYFVQYASLISASLDVNRTFNLLSQSNYNTPNPYLPFIFLEDPFEIFIDLATGKAGDTHEAHLWVLELDK